MPARPTEEDFRQHEGTKFRVLVEAPEPFELELLKVQGYQPQENEGREMERYSLTFNGPAHMFLQQGTYAMEHPAMGEMQLFIVPIGRDERGFQYEVVFNYFRDK
jgi:hypothetical protein